MGRNAARGAAFPPASRRTPGAPRPPLANCMGRNAAIGVAFPPALRHTPGAPRPPLANRSNSTLTTERSSGGAQVGASAKAKAAQHPSTPNAQSDHRARGQRDPQVCTFGNVVACFGSGTPPWSWPCPFASLLAAARRRTAFTRRRCPSRFVAGSEDRLLLDLMAQVGRKQQSSCEPALSAFGGRVRRFTCPEHALQVSDSATAAPWCDVGLRESCRFPSQDWCRAGGRAASFGTRLE